MNEYYVYIYLDPRKPEYMVNEYLKFDHEPFYVGKGKGVRAWCHLESTDRSKNGLKKGKIKRIIDAGYVPEVFFIKKDLSEADAMGLEKEIIAAIGTKWIIKELSRGPLTNMTSGGDGYTACEELREIHRKRMTGEKNPMYGKTHTPESKEKIRAQSVKLKHSDELKKKWSEDRIGDKNAHAKKWIVQLPSGEEIIIENLRQFCKEKNISYNTLYNSFVRKKPITIYRNHKTSAEGYWLKSELPKTSI